MSKFGVRPPGGTVRGKPRHQAESLIAMFLHQYKARPPIPSSEDAVIDGEADRATEIEAAVDSGNES